MIENVARDVFIEKYDCKDNNPSADTETLNVKIASYFIKPRNCTDHLSSFWQQLIQKFSVILQLKIKITP